MASNPIQKKVRNAGLIGAAVTLLIMSVVVAFLLIQLNKIKEEQKEIEASYRTIYTLNQDVKSGQVITEDMLQRGTAQIQYIPSNATSTLETFINYSLTDKEGNKLYTDEKGTYLLKDNEYTEVYEENNKYYTYLWDGQKEEITGVRKEELYTDNYCEDENVYYLVRTASQKTRVYQEYETGEYYILRIKYNTTADRIPTREKEYIDILGAPLVAKIDMNQNTVLTLDMLSLGSIVTADVRKQEYNAVILPADLTTGDYIDIRVQLPTGQDFIVVSKKMVEIPVIDGMDSENTIWVNLSEDEILSMSCAIVEAYRINGTKIYATKYTDPGIQEAATPTYPISAETYALIKADPNVVEKAEQELDKRYTEAMVNIRNNNINKELEKDENSATNVPSKMNESIVKTQEERKKYLQSLANGATN